MNIDGSVLVALLSSTGSTEITEQSISVDEAISQEFAGVLLQKVRQINSQGNDELRAENGGTELLGRDNELHKIASLLAEKGVDAGVFKAMGNSLPTINGLQKDINLENTMEALASVMNTLDDVALDYVDLETEIDQLIKQIESIKTEQPEYASLDKKIDQVIDEIEIMRDAVINYQSLEIDKNVQLDKEEVGALGYVEYIMPETPADSFSSEPNAVIPSTISDQVSDEPVVKENTESTAHSDSKEHISVSDNNNLQSELVEQWDKITSKIIQIKEQILNETNLGHEASVQNKIDQLSAGVELLRGIFSEKKSTPININQLVTKQVDSADTNEDELLKLANQVATLNEPDKQEKIAVVPVYKELTTEITKPRLSLQKMTEDSFSRLVAKEEPADSLLTQQSNSLNRIAHDTPIINTKLNEKIDALDVDIKKLETSVDKGTPKFATDIANLNRVMLTENKVDVPPMSKHFAHPEWNKEIAERVVWMHKQEIPAAELRLNPRHLGPVTIKLDVSQDQATVAFTAQHAAVKEAIEAALPKLRELFSAQQLNLAEVNVSQDDTGQRQSRGFSQMGAGSNGKGRDDRHELESQELAHSATDISDEIEAGRAIASNGILSIFA